jgi:hypothetical protein
VFSWSGNFQFNRLLWEVLLPGNNSTLLSTEIRIAEYRRWIPERLNLTK